MRNFRYRALTQNGEIVHGTISAPTAKEVIDRIEYLRLLPIETVEEKVIEHYGTVQLRPKNRDMIELTLSEDFAGFRQEIAIERKALDKHKKRLLAERAKLLQAHYADAVPLDLLKTEQARIADQLAYIEQRFGATDEHEAEINFNLRRTLELATDVQESYRASDDSRRRLLNQCFFKKLTIHDDGHVESEFAEPYDVLLSPTLRARAETSIQLGEVAVHQERLTQPDWRAWETSFNDNTRKAFLLAGVGKSRGPRGRQGLNNEILVGAGGFEPP